MTQNLNLNQKLTCNGTGRYQNEYKKSNKICRVFRQGAMQKHAGYWPKNQKSEEDVARLEYKWASPIKIFEYIGMVVELCVSIVA